MCVAPEALKKPAHLLVHHRVTGHALVEVGLLCRRRQFAIEQEVAGLKEVAVLGQLLNRITAIEQYALVAIDISDLGFAARRRREPRIVGEHPGYAVERADVDHVWANGSRKNRKIPALVSDGDLAGFFCARSGVHLQSSCGGWGLAHPILGCKMQRRLPQQSPNKDKNSGGALKGIEIEENLSRLSRCCCGFSRLIPQSRQALVLPKHGEHIENSGRGRTSSEGHAQR